MKSKIKKYIEGVDKTHHTDPQIMVDSIKKRGQAQQILVAPLDDYTYLCLDGVCRLKAMLILKRKTILAAIYYRGQILHDQRIPLTSVILYNER